MPALPAGLLALEEELGWELDPSSRCCTSDGLLCRFSSSSWPLALGAVEGMGREEPWG